MSKKPDNIKLLKELVDDWYTCDDEVGSDYYENLIKDMMHEEENRILSKLNSRFGTNKEGDRKDSTRQRGGTKRPWGYFD